MLATLDRLLTKWHRKGIPPKIVGLMPARNEGPKLQISLKALACYTDAIVYLDDCSTDDSIQQVEACSRECRVERILRNDHWRRDESADRNRLLQAGREIGGTHFIVIDADEVLTSNLLVNDHLRNSILKLSPGDSLSLPWIHLWQGTEIYRVDGAYGAHHYKNCIFCDDGKGSYASDFFHTPRVPKMRNRRRERWPLPYGLMHFQWTNPDNVCLKQKWYAWLERVERPERSVTEILDRYRAGQDEAPPAVESSPMEWFENYPFFDASPFSFPDQWRLDQMKDWEKAKGADYFSALP